jgi:hypothetical protein
MLYFNQPMDQPAVEAALVGEPSLSGTFSWPDASTLVFQPDQPLLPNTRLTIQLQTSARAQNGLTLPTPVALNFQTVGYLELFQALPQPNTKDVDVRTAILAAFNQPVVPIGGDPATLPVAFTLEPGVAGHGEWLNSSTYAFYPKPSLAGGVTYQVRVNPGLRSTAGSPSESNADWTFSTALPRLVSMIPTDGSVGQSLDTAVRIDFSQPMDKTSVAANFELLDSNGQAVPGQVAWNDDFTTLIYTPTVLLQRNTQFTAVLKGEAQSLGGTPLDTTTQARWFTVPELLLYASDPNPGDTVRIYGGVRLYLTSILRDPNIEKYLTLEPSVPDFGAYFDTVQKTINLYGMLAPETDYTLTVSGDLADAWGSKLGQPFVLRFRAGPLDPTFSLTTASDIIFLTPAETSLPAQIASINRMQLARLPLSLADVINMLGPEGYLARQNPPPREAQSWIWETRASSNKIDRLEIPISPDERSLAPGLYWLSLYTPELTVNPFPPILVVSNIQMIFKLSASDALIWAVDLRNGMPLAGHPVTVYAEDGAVIGSGQTDAQGIWRGELSVSPDPYATAYAVIDQPGMDTFSLALSTWNQGIDPWAYDIPVDYTPPGLKVYLYTERPIYRPGQTIYFRAVVRQAYNGRYSLPDLSSYPLKLYDGIGQELASFDLPLSAYGSGHGQYTLLQNASPGEYRLGNDELSIYFQVADYRKPEINLQVTMQSEEILAGQPIGATVNARYFFDAPAGNLPLEWGLYAFPSYLYIPGSDQVGPIDTAWMDPFPIPQFGSPLGELVASGKSSTNPDGLLQLEFPTQLSNQRQQYTLEVTIKDPSGLPVSARQSVILHPADFYISVSPDTWTARAGEPSGFSIQVIDWQGNPVGERSLQAQFRKVTWTRQDPPPERFYELSRFIPEYTPIASANFTTASDGAARLEFTPPEPGTYQLDLSGGGALTQIQLWAGGPGTAIWPNLLNQRIRLIADRVDYQPGDRAQVFIPNPFGQPATALVTLERGIVMQHQVNTLEAGGSTISLPLTASEAPNVYVSVTILGTEANGVPGFRQGYIAIPVEPIQHTLNVQLTSQPERTGPGETVTFNIRVTNASGEPVQGEFSLAVVDLAALALAESNSTDILTAFYGKQPLGVRTSLSLAAYARRQVTFPPGLGGGGGEPLAAVVREDFPDTAYWNAQVVTDAAGQAQITLTLPDSLTTWQVDARGTTEDTRVGQAMAQVITTKEFLVRPVTPRFLVAGDHVRLAAIVQNNTDADLTAEVNLQVNGFVLDNMNSATQTIDVLANSQTRVDWWGTVQDIPDLDIIFSARAGQLEDAARPAQGGLTVLRYTAPQTFSTAGVLAEGGEHLELVSLPVSFDPNDGALNIELAPSLAASMLSALDVLEESPYQSIEQTISGFLPNLQAYLALKTFAIDAPDLQERLERTIENNLEDILAYQNSDGGWGWWAGNSSDSYLTAYVLFGLARAHQAGISIPPSTIQIAAAFLNAGLVSPSMTTEGWQLDRLAMVNFALAEADAGNQANISALYGVRDQLSPWAEAVLALAAERLSPGNQETRTLISDLQSTAIRSASGAHWEDRQGNWRNMTTSLSTTAIVLYTLARLEPASALLPLAVDYLISNRQPDTAWASTYETAWSLLALVETMKGTGELGGDFAFSATLNGAPLASGQVDNSSRLNPVISSIPLSSLYADEPNALLLSRTPGPGRLYYNAAMTVYLPADSAKAIDRGIRLERSYYPAGADCPAGDCNSIESFRVGETIRVRISLVLPVDAYYLIVEDYIPAGTEILDTRLKTTQQGYLDFAEPEPLYDPRNPYQDGWGWWLFSTPQIYPEHIRWTVDSLPAGNYELTYTLQVFHAGEFHVLPARAWQFYFPEVQGSSAGARLEIDP